MKTNKIVVLYLVYGKEYVKEGIKELEIILDKMFGDTPREWLVIDNAEQIDKRKVDNKNYIHGDNSYFEFSGWDKGIRFAQENLGTKNSDSLYLFANDTFFRRNYSEGEDFLSVFNKDLISKGDIVNSAIGYLDDFPKEVSIKGINYSQWIRSNIFFLPSTIVNALYPLTFPLEKEKLFSENKNMFWSDNSLISNNWKAYISCWLFGEVATQYPEYQLRWLKAQPLNEENRRFFQKKAVTILSEHYLTARLFDMKVPIIDVNIFPKKIDRHTAPYYK